MGIPVGFDVVVSVVSAVSAVFPFIVFFKKMMNKMIAAKQIIRREKGQRNLNEMDEVDTDDTRELSLIRKNDEENVEKKKRSQTNDPQRKSSAQKTNEKSGTTKQQHEKEETR